MDTSQSLEKKIIDIVGKDFVFIDKQDMVVYESDGTHDKGMPDFVVLPGTTEEVSKLVILANEFEIPIIARGSGTGLSGGAVPIHGGLVISLNRMNSIIEIDVNSSTATVEAGVINLEISNKASEYGLFYAPDPSSQQACSIGGNIAENSGGPHCLAYGVTTNHVLAIEVVLPDGEITWFGDLNKEEFGLIELNCEERAGLIWVTLSPEVEFDIDSWLGDFALELETLNLKEWHIFDQREIEGPGWKVALDGYLEAYHHNQLHGDTVGKHTVGNLLVLDTYGPHQRLTFGRKSLSELIDKPEEEWEDPLDHIRLIHSGFPNLSISGVLGGHCLVSQIFPTSSPEFTITRQTILSAEEPKTKEEKKTTQDFSDMVLQAVVDEDYKMGLQIQSNISKLESHNFVYGKNEPAVQNYHNWIDKFMNKEGSNW